MVPNDPQTRRRFLRTSGVALATAGLATTASAQTETNSPPQGLLANGLSVDAGDGWAFGKALAGSYLSSVSPTPSAKTLADRMRNEFEANANDWVAYGNWLISEYDEVEPLGTVTLGLDVKVSRYWPNEDEIVETTIIAEYDDSAEEFTDVGWWIETPDDPDYQVQIQDEAAKAAADELQEFRRKFIAEEDGESHTLPDETYVSRLAGKYARHTRWGEDSKHILELLLGGTAGDITGE